MTPKLLAAAVTTRVAKGFDSATYDRVHGIGTGRRGSGGSCGTQVDGNESLTRYACQLIVSVVSITKPWRTMSRMSARMAGVRISAVSIRRWRVVSNQFFQSSRRNWRITFQRRRSAIGYMTAVFKYLHRRFGRAALSWGTQKSVVRPVYTAFLIRG